MATTPGDGQAAASEGQLQRTLGPVMIWALGVGYVISGSYFGWNYGLPEAGGPWGMLVAMALVTVMYVTFVLGYAELSCALPRAGGAFVYAHAAFGPGVGFMAGVAQAIEFVFAPPAIAFAIGAYLAKLEPALSPPQYGAIAFVLFTALNVWGVKQSAIFELVITVIAVVELLIFAGVAAPSFSWAAFGKDAGPVWQGVLPAIPFAIWFYLAIEGVANVAEEARDPKRDLSRGFGSAMLTLVVLASITFFSAVGVDGWRTVVYPAGSDVASDSPLPLALGKVVNEGHILYKMLVGIGLFGLLASFHGIILAAGRATFEMGRMGFAPRALGVASERFKTPMVALLVNSGVGLVALFSGEGVTGNIISVSVLGALTLYVISMAALFRLRATQPDLPRPFVTPLYPVVPAIALTLSVLCLVATLYYSKWAVRGAFVGVFVVSGVWYLATRAGRDAKPAG